jgi:hypothetical protein
VNKFLFFILNLLVFQFSYSQKCDYWQQKVQYKIIADVDVLNHTYAGLETVTYFNNSPDTLTKIYFHLYFNAFQSGSSFAYKTLTIIDPEKEMDEKFKELNPDESGKIAIHNLKQDERDIEYQIYETILIAKLNRILLPGDSCVFTLNYDAKIPKLIRRTGWGSKEGIDLSMAQWYPKIAAYDREGFHPDVYIGREFYGVWGDFDVTIDIDKSYIVAAGTEFQSTESLDSNTIRYHFIAKNIHDFVWTADRDYVHYSIQADNNTCMNFYFQGVDSFMVKNWFELGDAMKKVLAYMNNKVGKYQYNNFSFIEGGDGGMEYPLACLVTGNRSFNSLVGISVHEFIHAWFYAQIANNESNYPWMDEGFTSFYNILVLQYLDSMGVINRKFPQFPFQNDYDNYIQFALSDYWEPMNKHSDHYKTNYAYSMNAYIGGMVFLKQMESVVGLQAFERGIKHYFEKWKFKNPLPIDFIKVMEHESDIELKWYLDYFINKNGVSDYAIDSVVIVSDKLYLFISRVNNFPLPVDFKIEFSDGSDKFFSIPSDLMLNHKNTDYFSFQVINLWKWLSDSYQFSFELGGKKIIKIEIDPSQRIADINRKNNIWISEY